MKKTIIVGMAALLLLFGVLLAGCSHDGDDNGGSNPLQQPPGEPGSIGYFTPTLIEDSKLTQAIGAICYGEGKFVAGDSGGTISYSEDDGVTWTLVPGQILEGNCINSFAYGNGTFVAVGYEGQIAYSKDDITAWTDITVGTDDLRIVIFAKGKFAAAGGNGVILYSPDGITWNEADDSHLFGTENIWALAYGDGKYVAGAHGGSGFATSSDGSTWTRVDGVDVGTDGDVHGMAFFNGKFVASLHDGDVLRNSLLSSGNGIAWNPVDISPLDGIIYDGEGGTHSTTEAGCELLRNFTVGDNRILAISAYQADIVGSVDGTTWAKAGTTSYESGGEITSMAYGNGKFLFAGNDGKIYRLVE